MFYTLNDDKSVTAHNDIEQYVAEIKGERTIAFDVINDVIVSTVFLCTDHGSDPNSPLLFETMVFGSNKEYCKKYSSYADALAGHINCVKDRTWE